MKALRIIYIAIAVALMSHTAAALATRTWVSGVGNDTNPCTRSQPCQTFATAITKTAAGGEIDALDAGPYDAVTITKAITINGGGGTVASIVSTGTNAINIQAGSSDVVTLRNLTINGFATGTNGIQFASGKELHVENCVVFGFTSVGIYINVTAAAQVTVESTISRDNEWGFRSVMTAFNTTVSVNVVRSSFPSNAFGIWADNNSNVTVTNSDASGNSTLGFIAQATGSGATAVLNLSGSNSANNDIGVQSGGGLGNSIVNLCSDTLFNNATGIVIGQNATMNTCKNSFNTGSGAPNGSVISPQ